MSPGRVFAQMGNDTVAVVIVQIIREDFFPHQKARVISLVPTFSLRK